MDWLGLVLIIVVVCGVTFIILDARKDKAKRKIIDKHYNVNKFPVTSTMGNQYYAEIIYNHKEYRFENFSCKIYTRSFNKKGKSKDKIIVNRDVEFENKNLDYDYIKVVSLAIGEYEAEHQAELSKYKHENEVVAANKKLFNEWDGIIREEI